MIVNTTYRQGAGNGPRSLRPTLKRLWGVDGGTQLDRFTDIECEALMYHVYTLTDAVLWAHRQGCPSAYRVADIPAPQWRIDFTPDVVARWTRGLAKSGATLAWRR